MNRISENEQQLSLRILRLERSGTRWRILAQTLVAVVSIGGLLGATSIQRSVISATQFEVVDEKGHVKALLGTENGNCSLEFKDDNGSTRTELVLQSDGTTSLNLRDGHAVDRISLSVLADGNNSLVFRKADKSTAQSIGGRTEGDLIGSRVAACEAKLAQVPTSQVPAVIMNQQQGNNGGNTPGSPFDKTESIQRDTSDAVNQQKVRDAAILRTAKQKEITTKLEELKRAQLQLNIDKDFDKNGPMNQSGQADVDKLRLELEELRTELDAIH